MREFGEMVEWSITPVLKTGVLRGTGGSNPSLSAQKKEGSSKEFPFLFPYYWRLCFVRYLRTDSPKRADC